MTFIKHLQKFIRTELVGKSFRTLTNFHQNLPENPNTVICEKLQNMLYLMAIYTLNEAGKLRNLLLSFERLGRKFCKMCKKICKKDLDIEYLVCMKMSFSN